MLLKLWFFIWLLVGSCSCSSIIAQQFYDSTPCTSNVEVPGSRYTCDSSSFQAKSCQTFLVYRTRDMYQTLLNVSTLFNMSPQQLLLNPRNNVSSSFQVLEPGREVVVPINCSCSSDGFYQSDFSYVYPGSLELSVIACEIYDGLVKPFTLSSENSSRLRVGSRVHVPLKCACPDKGSSILGVKYLVTYPLVENDDTSLVSQKFNVSMDDIWAANHMDPNPTIYPSTTILLPLKGEPIVNFDVPVATNSPPSQGFIPTVPYEEPTTKHTELKKVYISVSVVGSTLILVSLVICGLYLRALRRNKAENMNSFASRRSPMTSFSTQRSSQVSGPTPKSSTTSCLSPDLLESIKYSLCNYSTDELKKATNEFSEEAKISDDFFRGFIDDTDLLIKQTRFEDTRQLIEVHSKVNHVNILKLHGVCYGEDDFSWCYLVFESPSNGCLRDCLSMSTSSSSPPQPRWNKRTQIAFDIATGLHYLHYCILPPYTHVSVSSKTIFLTQSWRAKIAVFENSSNVVVGTSKEQQQQQHESPSGGGGGGWGAGEHFAHSLVLEKEDIFAFGVVLLELLSAKEEQDWRMLRESITFLGGGSGNGNNSEKGCFDQLRNFMDPNLKEEYPLAEALCLAVLAKACVEDDPLKRPSMDDILKVVARMVTDKF